MVLVGHREVAELLLRRFAGSNLRTTGLVFTTCIARHLGAAAALLDRPDFYLMNADGTEMRRLTYFHETGHSEYIPRSYGGNELDWSPDGKRIAALVAYEEGGLVGLKAKIVIIELE